MSNNGIFPRLYNKKNIKDQIFSTITNFQNQKIPRPGSSRVRYEQTKKPTLNETDSLYNNNHEKDYNNI